MSETETQDPTVLNLSEHGNGHEGHFGLPEYVSVAIHGITETKFYLVEEFAGGLGKTFSRAFIPLEIAIFEVPDIIDAFQNGSTDDVIIQTAGAGGSVLGGVYFGGQAGALASGFTGNPYIIGAATIFGGVLGAWAGEDIAEAWVEGLLSDEPSVPRLSVVDQIAAENPHIPREVIAETVASQVAAFQEQTRWTMLEVNPWDVIDLDQINSLEQAYIIADGWTRHDPGGPGGGGSSSARHDRDATDSTLPGGTPQGSGGSGGEVNHSLGSPTGYSDRGVYDVEGPEAGAAGAPSGTYHSYDHYSDLGNGSTAVTGLPVILDLGGDGVEVNASAQVNFGWDGDGFLESGNWATADEGILGVECEPLKTWRNAA